MSRIIGNCIFALLLLYSVHGALVGDLYLPSKYGPGMHTHGAAAWSVVGAVVCFWSSLFFAKALDNMPSFARVCWIAFSACVGIGLLAFSFRG